MPPGGAGGAPIVGRKIDVAQGARALSDAELFGNAVGAAKEVEVLRARQIG